MTSFEQRMQDAVQKQDIPGAVLIAQNRSGTFRYERAFGVRSLAPSAKDDPMPIDATMWLASCTKFMTTIAVMQCVERGLLKLDEDVTGILHELKGIKILTGFEAGKDGEDVPVLVESKEVMTLRHLLTHSSGMTYDLFNPTMQRYQKSQNKTVGMRVTASLQETYLFPLLFEPGEGWEYSVGIDWAGWMVERVTKLSLENYVQKHIWGPLGVTSFSFAPKKHPNIMSKMTAMSIRSGGVNPFGAAQDPNGKLEYTEDTIWNMDTPGCAGGAGGFGAPLDYHKMLHSILANDSKLLHPSSIDEMFSPQLTDASRTALMAVMSIPEVNAQMDDLPAGIKLDYGLSGSLLLEDVKGGRRKGSMQWSGYPNLFWFIDREEGLAGVFGSQICPPGDDKVNGLFKAWEQELYGKGGKEKL